MPDNLQRISGEFAEIAESYMPCLIIQIIKIIKNKQLTIVKRTENSLRFYPVPINLFDIKQEFQSVLFGGTSQILQFFICCKFSEGYHFHISPQFNTE
jgi:hypothetical protein